MMIISTLIKCRTTTIEVRLNLGKEGMYGEVKREVVLQEYLRGEEFVVNTVSVDGHHRVCDMWRVNKVVVPAFDEKSGRCGASRILYDHQLLVARPGAEIDVIDFCFAALDKLGLTGGAAHLEVVRLGQLSASSPRRERDPEHDVQDHGGKNCPQTIVEKNVRLIEINPRFAGHRPRATKQIGADQCSALALAIADPRRFIEQAKKEPFYDLRSNDEEIELVMTVFLRSSRDAEVSRTHLLEIITLPSFWKFDREPVADFADKVRATDVEGRILHGLPAEVGRQAVEDSVDAEGEQQISGDAFFVCATTEDLFTVPLTILLRGSEAELRRDLCVIRSLEKTMYRPFGAHDGSWNAGVLTGGDQQAWLDAVKLPKVGVRVQRKRGTSTAVGTVARSSKDHIHISWDDTGALSDQITKNMWLRHFKRVGGGASVPGINCRLQALPGVRHPAGRYEDGEIGTVTSWKLADSTLRIKWDRTGASTTCSAARWAESYRVVSGE